MASRTCCPYTQHCTATRSEYSSAVAPENLTGSLHEPAHNGSQPRQPQQGSGANPAEYRSQASRQTALPAISQLLFDSPSQLSSNGSRAKRRAVAIEAQAGRDDNLLSAVQQVGISRGSQPAGTMSGHSQVARDASQQFTEAPCRYQQDAAADLSSMQASELSAAGGQHSPQHLPWPWETENAASRLNCSAASHQGQPGNELQARYAGDAATHAGSQHAGSHLLAPQRQPAPASLCTRPAAGDLAIATASSFNQPMAPTTQRPTVSQQQTWAGGSDKPGNASQPQGWGPSAQPGWNGIVRPWQLLPVPQPALPQQQSHPPVSDEQKSQHSRVTGSSGHRATSGGPQHAAVDGGRSYQVAGGGPKSHSCSCLPPSSGAVHQQAPSNNGGAICHGLPQNPGQGPRSSVGSGPKQAGTLPLHPIVSAGQAPQQRVHQTHLKRNVP